LSINFEDELAKIGKVSLDSHGLIPKEVFKQIFKLMMEASIKLAKTQTQDLIKKRRSALKMKNEKLYEKLCQECM